MTKIPAKGPLGGGGNKKGIWGIRLFKSMIVSAEETVDRLVENGIQAEHKFDIFQSRPGDPQKFVLGSGAKISRNITGYEILLMKNGGRINGNLTVNGLGICKDNDVILRE